MDKQTSTAKLKELEITIYSIEKEKVFDIEQLVNEKVEPLLEQASQMKVEINTAVHNKYKDVLSQLHKERLEVKEVVDNFKIEEANDLWYVKGTIVYLWEKESSWYAKEKKNTGLKGVVDVYDGTQTMSASISKYSLPKKGDIIVKHLKKDGSVGLKFDQISEYGVVKNYFPDWCAEGDTPTNNPVTRKRDEEDEN